MMTMETIKLVEVLSVVVKDLSYVLLTAYALRLAFNYLQHRLDVTGKPLFEERSGGLQSDPTL